MFYGRGAGGDPTATAVVGRPGERRPEPARRRPGGRVHVLPRAHDPADRGDDRPVLHPAARRGPARRARRDRERLRAPRRVSIKSVWQEGTGGDAQLVFITHRALEGRVPARRVRAPRPARGRGGPQRPAGGGARNDGARPWRGVIEEYRDRLPVDERTPVVTLCEGGTPLVRSEPLSAETGCEVWLKYEGANPTASFKDRGMTLAISKAVEEGSKAVVCASTGQHERERRRLRGQGRADVRRPRPEGQDRDRARWPATLVARCARARGRGELRRRRSSSRRASRTATRSRS